MQPVQHHQPVAPRQPLPPRPPAFPAPHAPAAPARTRRTGPRILALIGGLLTAAGFAALIVAGTIVNSYGGGELETQLRAVAGDGKAQLAVDLAQLAGPTLLIGLVVLAVSAVWALTSRPGRGA